MKNHIKQVREIISSSIKPLRDLQKNAEVDDKLLLSDLTDKLKTALDSIDFISDEYDRLKKEFEHHQNWDEEKANHMPHKFFSGSTVMIPSISRQSPYTAIWYCKHCFDKENKSQLQPDPRRHWEYFCPECKTAYPLSSRDQEAYNEAHNIHEDPPPEVRLMR